MRFLPPLNFARQLRTWLGSAPKTSRPLRFEQLEPRVLLSGDLQAAIVPPEPDLDANPATDVDELANAIALAPGAAADLTAAGPEPQGTATQTDASVQDNGPTFEILALDAEASDETRSVVFVDTSIDGYELLADGIDPTAQVVLLDADQDGVAQIAATLADRSGIDAIHLITHGDVAALQIGTATLTVDVMAETYADELAVIRKALSADADILIYGCDFGRGELGKFAAERLSSLTGADIAASSDPTGAEALGGDWELEYVVGDVDTNVAFTVDVQANWYGTLETVTVTNTTDVANGTTTSIAALQANDGGDGISLREAILAANNTANAGAPDEVHFEITDPLVGGFHTISVAVGGLPGITEAVLIDATTDSDFGTTPVVALDGLSAGSVDGLSLLVGSDGSTIRGLVVHSFGNDGIQVDSSNNIIVGNYIGTDGVGDLGNAWDGITLSSTASNNRIGGTSVADRNLLSGNDNDGIWINGATYNIVQGNWIGLDASGGAQGNSFHGIGIDSSASGNLIGGTVANSGNRIGNNTWDGIAITNAGSTGNSIIGNTITGNGGLGIDIDNNNVTANDYSGTPPSPQHDADSGANDLQNYPDISTAEINGTDLSFYLDLRSAPTTQYRIEVFGIPAGQGDTAGHGEAYSYLGTTTITTDANGEYSNFVNLNGVTLSAGDLITATATVIDDPGQVGVDDVLAYGNTSEFAANVSVTATNTNPTDLAATSTVDGGLSINEDGGNNAYLEANDGDAIFGGLTSLSIEAQFQSTQLNSEAPHLLNYAVSGQNDEVTFLLSTMGSMGVAIDGQFRYMNTTETQALRDGNMHSVGVTWDSAAGDLHFYIDGNEVGAGYTGFKTGTTINGGGTIFVGAAQASAGVPGLPGQVAKSTLFDMRVFDDVRTASEIAANYRLTLPHNESGMIANWTFDKLSTDGVVTDEVSGNNLTVQRVSVGGGFTESDPSLVLQVTENAVNGTVVGTVAGIDAERQAAIATIVGADPNLRYDPVSDKFYKFDATTTVDWNTAQTIATNTTLGGVNGQLVTIRSAHENALVHDIQTSMMGSNVFWLGGGDFDDEGTWKWYDGSTASDTFWVGDQNGNASDASYANWSTNDPNDFGPGEDAALMRSDGLWQDVRDSNNANFIVEWDADEVLDTQQALSYSLVDDAGGRFAIDNDNGTITVADGSQLDYEAATSHDITVRVTDVDSNVYDEVVTIAVNDYLDVNNASIDLSSGIELNTDGGNDAYLIANDGGAVLGGLTSLSIEIQFATNDTTSFTPLYSYASPSNDNEFAFVFSGTDAYLYIADNDILLTGMDYSQLRDGTLQHLAVSWDNTNGDWAVYSNGKLIEQGTSHEIGNTIEVGGELVFGNEQDSLGGTFQADQAFRGTLHDIRIWDEVRSEADIALNWQQKIDPASIPSGLIANWQMDHFTAGLEVVDIVSGNNLSIGHVSGAGFVASVPNDELDVDENSANGTHVGYVVPTDPDLHNDIVSDGLFQEGPDPGLWTQYKDGQTLGPWTFEDPKGPTGVAAYHLGTYAESSPLGGHSIEFDGDGGELIYQDLATEVGRQYQVVFALSGDWATPGEVVQDVRVSAGGTSADFSVTEPPNWSLSNMLWAHRSLSFTATDTTTRLGFTSLDNTANSAGAVIADVQVIEIPASISTILNNDTSLSYDAATGKFYKVVTTPGNFNNALTAATTATLNGVGGQLGTIGSEYEQQLFLNFHAAAGSDIWLGATDVTTEGDWYWLDGANESELFWTGGGSGSAVAGQYVSTFSASDDPGEDNLRLHADGMWADQTGTASFAYVIEWDASEVLSNFTFSLTDDAGGRFAIDASTGEITVANGSLLDYETAASHDVTVEVTDAAGATYSEVINIAVNDVPVTSVTATGAPNTAAGSTYTLNLTADEDVASWTINWGDGTITTYVGDPSSVTHSYSADLAGLMLDITVSATDGSGQHFESVLLAPAYGGDYVARFDGDAGTPLSTFAPFTDGIDGHANIVIMPSGNYLVSGVNSGNILEYQPDGTLVGDFVAASDPNLSNPGGMAYGPDGNLYVADYGSGQVLRYDGVTGTYIDDFVASGLTSPLGLEFGPDGNLYVANRGSAGVLRYDGQTSVLDSGFNVAGISGAEDLTFGPDGNVYVGGTSGVTRVDAVTGATSTFVATGAGGLGLAAGVEFGPDGNLYVGDQNNNVIRRYNGSTGVYIDDYAAGVMGPAFIEFTPDHRVTVGTGVNQQVPSAQATAEDTALVFSTAGGNAISVDDGTTSTAAELQVRLTTLNGTITLSQTTGLSFPGGSNGSSHMVMWGTEADINAALEGATFTPDPDYNGPVTIDVETKIAAGLHGHYEFENAGDLGQDTSVGALQSGTINGNVTLDNDATRGNVLSLGGDGDYIDITSTFGDPSDLTLSAWVKYTTTDIWAGTVISLGDVAMIRVEDSAHGTNGQFYDGTTWQPTSTVLNLDDGQWHHIAFTFDDTADTQVLYVDGVAVNTTNYTGSIDWAGGFSNTRIGAHPGPAAPNFDFNGNIDGVRVYTRALTADEIAAVANDAAADLDTINVTVDPINDAPTISFTDNQNVNEDQILSFNSGNGNLITIGDVDAGANPLEVTLSVNNGTLSLSQTTGLAFSTGDGTNDSSMTFQGSAADINAALDGLVYDSSLHYYGSDTLVVSVDDLGNNGTGGAQNDSVNIALAVDPVNDQPLISYNVSNNGTEDTPYTFSVASGKKIEIVDRDDAGGIMELTLSAADGMLTFSQTTGLSFTTGDGTLDSLIVVRGTEADLNAAMDGMTLTPDADFNGATTVTATVNDLGNTGGGDLTRMVNVPVTFAVVNDAPVEASIEGAALAYTENAGAVVITNTLALSDVDDTQLESALIQITGNYATGEDVLSFVDQNGITGSWNAVTGAMSLSGTATVAHYQSALRSITYQNSSDDPSTATRTVSFTVNDGASNSNTLTRDIGITVVNDAPVEASIEGAALAYTENAGAVVITNTLALSDVDDTQLESALIQITGNYATGEDVLSFVDQNGITGSWNAVTGAMNLSGTATVAHYQSALRSITYQNSSDDPSTATRTVSFTVNDGASNSNTLTRDIGITVVNDAPVEASIEGAALAYTENAGAVVITNTLALSDVDDTQLESALIQITGNYATGEDVLSFVDQNGITGSWNAVTGAMSLSGTATVAHYQSALRSITYQNSSDDPSTATRTVSFTVNDGASNSNTLTRDIGITVVNDAPVEASIEGAALAYTENAGAVVITNTLALSDVDDTQLESALIQITGNYATGEDVLSFVDQNGITGSWNAVTGAMNLSGTATVAHYQSALRSITYQNSSDDPSTATRTVSFTVNDGASNSNTLTRDIGITVVNDAPVEASIEGAALAYTENAGAVVITNTLALSDVDDTQLESALIQITGNYATGEDVLSFVDQNGITGSWNAVTGAMSLSGTATVAHYQSALRSITYQNSSDDPSTATRTVSFTVNDGASNSNTLTRDIGITVVNDAPVEASIEGAALAYTENAGAVVITNTLALSDVDDTQLESALIQITGNYATGEDVLSFVDQNGITGSWNAVTGAMSLSGTATVAHYQSALRSITYQNSSDDPSTATRTVSFTVNDGASNSNTLTRDIGITVVNDAPVEASIEGAALAYTENAGAVVITNTLALSDVDDTQLESALIQITGNYATGEDVLSFVDQNGITGSWNAVTGAMNLSGTATVAHYQSALRSITYQNSSDDPSTATRTVSFTVNDGASNSNTLTRDIGITVVNDAPVEASIEGAALAYTENAGAVVITNTLALSDVDDTQLESALIQITGNYATGEDVLSFVDQNGITGSWNAVTGAMNLSGTATVAHYQSALRSITYQNSSDDPSTATRTVSFTVNDGASNSNTLTRDIGITVVNDAPVEASIEGAALAYTENAGAVVITNTLALSDVDDTQLESALIQITGNYATGEDVLSFVDQNGITGSWNAVTGAMSLSGTATVAHYQSALRSITYQNSSDDPSTATRTVSFTVNDGASNSNTLTRDIGITVVNDVPVITDLGGDTLAYTEGAGAVVIDQSTNAAVSDIDSANFDTGTLSVSVSSGGDTAEDILAIRDQGTMAGQVGVSGSNVTYNFGAGAIPIGTFTGGASGADLVITLNNAADATATAALIQNITYENTDTDNPTTGARTVRYVLTDGDGGTSADYDTTVTVTAVNDVPVAVGNTVVTSEDTAFPFAVADFAFTDAEGDALVSAQIMNLSLNGGTLTHSGGMAVNDGDTLTAAQLDTLIYTPPSNQGGNNFARFDYRVDDADSGTVSAAMTINVLAANDAPVITSDGGGEAAFITRAVGETDVTRVMATDLDGDVLRFEVVGGADAGIFTLDAVTGELRLAGVDAPGAYEVIVGVTDGRGGRDQQVLEVELTGAQEILGPIVPSEGGEGSRGRDNNEAVAINVAAVREELDVDALEEQAKAAHVQTLMYEILDVEAPAIERLHEQPVYPVREAVGYSVTAGEEMGAPAVVSVTPEAGDELWVNMNGLNRQLFVAALERASSSMLERLNDAAETEMAIRRSAEFAGVMAAAGILNILLKASSLLGATMASLPLWRWVDPIPVLSTNEDEKQRFESAKKEAQQYEQDVGDVLDKKGNSHIAADTDPGENSRA